METADAILKKVFDKLDIEHLQEEIERMDATELRKLESRLEVLIMRLLKYQDQSNMKTRNWTLKKENTRAETYKNLLFNYLMLSNIV